MKPLLLFNCCWALAICTMVNAQTGRITGTISGSGLPLASASIQVQPTNRFTLAGNEGRFEIAGLAAGEYNIHASATGYVARIVTVVVDNNATVAVDIELTASDPSLSEVVVTGTLRPVSRHESPVPIEIITPQLFRKSPAPSLFESVCMINGVRPQINCNVCNTGDIRINGMDGPYTMILIDGMPIVSALSTVYGLNGIPVSLIERVEVAKGPGSSLYGSEAMGGIINVITKDPAKAPKLAVELMGTSWQELNADIGASIRTGKLVGIAGLNYFNFQQRIDHNNDGFTDQSLQHRTSLFNKWSVTRRENRVASLALRYVYEDRWGGQTNWSPRWRGTDSIYGESIYTSRFEAISMYQLPIKERVLLQLSFNNHDQNAAYGFTPYQAKQQVVFAQAYWDRTFSQIHNLLAGFSYRHTFYDDNTPGTLSSDGSKNQPSYTSLPGLFVQDEWKLAPRQTLLLGYRFDYNHHHGGVHSPRIAYKWSPAQPTSLRASIGTGFRVVNLFTEDHAALTGAREVLIAEELKPERSINGNINFITRITRARFSVNFDVTAFYSHFSNRIIGDFDTDPNKIIYDNLRGHAVSRGFSLNTDFSFMIPLKITAGVSFMDVFQMERSDGGSIDKIRQLHAPKWSGNFTLSYPLPANWLVDLTGQWNGPMRLPILPNDYRPEYSPWYCIANIQLSKKFKPGWELYGGAKNLLNFLPRDPIMRAFDPFDKYADDPVNNPNGYSFDPSYNYASLQGIRAYLGFRYHIHR